MPKKSKANRAATQVTGSEKRLVLQHLQTRYGLKRAKVVSKAH